MRKRYPMGPYKVLKEFTFQGVLYKSGEIFDPLKAHCDQRKFDILADHRFICPDDIVRPVQTVREDPPDNGNMPLVNLPDLDMVNDKSGKAVRRKRV